MLYVISRNAGGRPTLQHIVSEPELDWTVCGVFIGHWSRQWMHQPLGPVLCLRCKHISGQLSSTHPSL